MKIPRKIVRYIIITAGAIILALILIAAVYKDRVAGMVIDEINSQSQFRISISRSGLSLLKRFPRATFWIQDVVVRGTRQVSGNDTIGTAALLSLDFRLTNLLRKNYTVEWISVGNGKINILTDSAGRSNIPAIKDTGKDKPDSDFNLNIRNIRISNMTFLFANDLKKTGNITHIESARVSGAIAGTDIDLKTEGTYEIRSLSLNGISVNSPVRAEMSLDMHKSDTAITVRKGTLDLERMSFSVSGYYLPETGTTDITIGSVDSDIRTLSGFITAKQGSWSGYKPEGKVTAVCHLTGTINRESKIHYEVAFSLSGVKLEIPGTGLQVRESSLTGFYTNGAQNNAITSDLTFDNIEVYTNRSEVRGSLSLSNFSNSFLSANISASVDLSEIDIFLKNHAFSDVSGLIRTSFTAGGTISSLRNIDLKTIAGMRPRANIWLSSVSFRKGELLLSDITGNLMLADHLWADSLNMSINDQRILADGEIRNFTRWIEGAADIVEISGSLSSPEFCTDMLFGNPAKREKDDSSGFTLPQGYKARLDIRAGEFRHKKFTAYDLSGEISYEGGRAALRNIHAGTLGGEVDGSLMLAENAAGGYATESNLVFRNIDIYNAFVSFNNFKQDFITAENLKGSLSGRYDMRMSLDKQFSPNVNSISSEGRFTIDNGELLNFSPIMSMSKFIEISELENIRFSRLENEFFISSGVFAIPQMEIKSSAADLGINGRHMFSGDYQYHLKVQLSQILSGKAPRKTTANEFGIIEDDGLGRTSLFLVVSQAAGKSSVKYDSRAARGEVKADLEREKQSLKGILKEELGWYGKDTTVVPAAEQKPKFRIIWDEAVQQDTIKADTTISTSKGSGVRSIFRKIIKG